VSAGVVAVPRHKKNPSTEGGSRPEVEGKFNAACKLRSAFHDKLKLVADDFGKIPGAIIEEHMALWVETQYVRVLRKRLAEAEAAAKGRPAE
jgi:hypothetical protein